MMKPWLPFKASTVILWAIEYSKSRLRQAKVNVKFTDLIGDIMKGEEEEEEEEK